MKRTKFCFVFLALLALLCVPLFSSCGGGNNDGPFLEANEVLSGGYVFRRVVNEWGDGYELVSFRYYGEQSRGDVINVPSHVEGKPVIGISGADETSLSVVILPDTLVYIKNSFRHCVNLTSLQIPASVTQITGESFLPVSDWGHGCPKLLQAENGFLYIGSWAVDDTELQEGEGEIATLREGTVGIADGVSVRGLLDDDDRLVIPEGVKHIGKLGHVLNNSVSAYISELSLPDSLETLGEKAFWAAVDTKEPIVLKNVKRIGKGAFSSCKFGELILPDTVEHIGDEAFYQSSFDKLHIGTGVRSLGYGVLNYCKIGELALPASLMGIAGNYYIEETKSGNSTKVDVLRVTGGEIKGTLHKPDLKALILDEGVTLVGANAFEECTALESLTIKGEGTVVDMTAFLACHELKDVTASAALLSTVSKTKLQRVHITAGAVRAIDFSHVTTLRELTLAAGVTVEQGAFANCAALATATVPQALLSVLPKGAVKSLTVTNCTTLFADTIAGFTALETITLPATLKGIGADAFLDMVALQSVYFEGTLDDWAKLNFANGAANPLSVAGDLFVDGTLVTAAEGLSALSPYAFFGYARLTSVSFAAGLSAIPESAFEGCVGLTAIAIPASVTEIGKNAFKGCTALSAVAFAVTEGWSRFDSAAAQSGSEIYTYYLADAASAASYVTETYKNYIWKRIL